MFMLPAPKETVRSYGNYILGKKLYLTLPEGIVNKAHEKHLAELFSNYTANETSLQFAVSPKLCGVAFVSDKPCDDNLSEKTSHDYELHITKENVKFVFNDDKGFIHAFVSLLQLIRIDGSPEDLLIRVPCHSIYDSPDMDFRAIHLCIFRDTSLNFLKKVISLCGIMKCSHVVLEFWGTYRFECCPNLSWKEAYTKEQIRPIVEYANAIGLEVIPMLNHLGHASQARICSGKHSALDTDLRLAPYFEEDGWSWCTSNPETLKLLENCRKELIDLCGEGSYFHIGCDEAYTFATCEKCRTRDKDEVMLEHIKNVSNDLKKYGRRAIMWGDMFLDKEKFLPPYECNGRGENKILGSIPKDVIIADWQYNVNTDFLSSQFFADKGFDVVCCPWTSHGNVAAAINTVKNRSLHGVIGTTWHTLQFMQWLIPCIADRMWGNGGKLTDQQYTLHCAYNVRRCVPPNGDYEKSGFVDREVPSISF